MCNHNLGGYNDFSMDAPIIIDVETQKTFRQVGGFHPEKLKISVASLFDYGTNEYYSFEEHEVPKMFPFLENASQIIGFNILDFDLPVINAYYVGKLTQFTTLDLMTDVVQSLGFRIALDDLIRETLGMTKQGHGLLAIEYFKSGEIEKLKKYCQSDVEITKKLYEYGKLNGKVFYKTAAGRREIPVGWGLPQSNTNTVNLTLPW